MVEISASFRIMSKELSLAKISELPGLVPDHSHESGSPRIGRSGRQKTSNSSEKSSGRTGLTSPMS